MEGLHSVCRNWFQWLNLHQRGMSNVSVSHRFTWKWNIVIDLGKYVFILYLFQKHLGNSNSLSHHSSCSKNPHVSWMRQDLNDKPNTSSGIFFFLGTKWFWNLKKDKDVYSSREINAGVEAISSQTWCRPRTQSKMCQRSIENLRDGHSFMLAKLYFYWTGKPWFVSDVYISMLLKVGNNTLYNLMFDRIISWCIKFTSIFALIQKCSYESTKYQHIFFMPSKFSWS